MKLYYIWPSESGLQSDPPDIPEGDYVASEGAHRLQAACEYIVQWLPRYIQLYGDQGNRLAGFVRICADALAAAEGEGPS